MTATSTPVPVKNLKGVMTYLKPELYEVLAKEAEAEGRSISNLIGRILADWVQQKKGKDS